MSIITLSESSVMLFIIFIKPDVIHLRLKTNRICALVSARDRPKPTCLRLFFCRGLCWGKAMVACTKPQQWKKEDSEKLRGARDQIKFIDLRFERWQVVRFKKARRRQDVP